jgi:RNA polymerase sigma-70 factor, ECF subfamily
MLSPSDAFAANPPVTPTPARYPASNASWGLCVRGSWIVRERPWIDGVRSGDAQAWARLVREHYARIYQLLAHLTPDRHAAEDLCQETFATAWAKIHTFAGGAAIGTWLHRIAYRKFLDARRASQARPAAKTTFEQLPPPRAEECDPLAGLLNSERSSAMHAALGQLEEAQRIVIVLHYLQGLSYREMSAITGEPIGTIKWRTSAAIERLDVLLTEETSGDEPKRNEKTAAATHGDALAADPAGA